MLKQQWKKAGCIYQLNNISDELFSHAAVPFVGENKKGVIEIYFSTRGKDNKSRLARILFDLNTMQLIEIPQKILLNAGSIGSFDYDGAMACGFYTIGNRKILTYIGWNLGHNVPFRNAIGLSEYKNGQFSKLFDGPVLDRSIHDPCFVASNCVIKKGNMYLMYYLSCVKWDYVDRKLMHYYHLKIAESIDGLNWKATGKIAIDFQYANEYAISVPRVLFENKIYKMWYSYRGGQISDTYRIGYAESEDGISWNRMDDLVGLDVSKSGWDSDMICYPFVFDYKGKRYMLYNGNDYGKTGVGLAILENV